MKIKDRVMLGIVSGILGALPGRILDIIEYKKGINDITYPQMAATLLIKKKEAKKPLGTLMGGIIDAYGSAITGVATSYTLTFTGRDHPVLKGIGVSYLFGLILGGTLPKLGIVTKPRKPVTAYLSLIDHTIMGALTGLIVAKLGHDSLFPDKSKAADETPFLEPIPGNTTKTGNRTEINH